MRSLGRSEKQAGSGIDMSTLSQAPTSTRSALSLGMSPFAAVSFLVSGSGKGHGWIRARPDSDPFPIGIVRSTKMNRTIVVRRDYLHYVKKYARCA